jgi:DNA-binding CsgD family transcriptional regulator
LADAARAAWSRGAPNTAAQLWELASTHVTQPPESALLRASAAECVFFAGDAARARELFEAAVADLPACPDRASVLLKLALVVYYEDGPNTALALCDRATADTGGDRLLEARLHLSRSWFSLNDAVLRARHLERARALITGEEAGAWPALLACVLIANAYFGLLAGFGLSSDDLERGQALLPGQSRTREACMARNVSRVLAKYLDPVRAHEEFTETVRHARESGDESAVMQGLVHLAELDCWLGDWERARTGAQEAIEAAEQTGQRPWRPYALYVLALVDAHRGQLDAAQETAELGLRLADEVDDSWVAVHQLWVLGFVELSRGDAVAAERRFSAALARCDSARLGDCCIAGLYGDHVEAVVMLGELDRAMELLDALERRRDLAPRPWMEVVASRARAMVRMAQGDTDGAADAMRAAFTALDNLPMPFERARTLLLYGRFLRRRKEKLAARDALLEAKRVFEALGSELWAAQTTAEAHRLGLRRGPGHDLTPAELRIAELVVSGLSNREVAATAFVSAKTVEAHLSRIYRKLGVRDRRELARYELRPAPQGATEQL